MTNLYYTKCIKLVSLLNEKNSPFLGEFPSFPHLEATGLINKQTLKEKIVKECVS